MGPQLRTILKLIFLAGKQFQEDTFGKAVSASMEAPFSILLALGGNKTYSNGGKNTKSLKSITTSMASQFVASLDAPAAECSV